MAAMGWGGKGGVLAVEGQRDGCGLAIGAFRVSS